nr:MAG TPA: hypothetical protein [Caudoviricetes sp.]
MRVSPVYCKISAILAEISAFLFSFPLLISEYSVSLQRVQMKQPQR